MLSKNILWDFFAKYPTAIDAKKPGLYSFLNTDPYIERMVLDRLKQTTLSFSLYSGNEVTFDFIEEQFINLSFFSSTEHIKIVNAENIPQHLLMKLIEISKDLNDRFVLLFFSKSTKGISDFLKHEDNTAFEIEPARFWEGPKLWQFCCKARGLDVQADVTRFILENVEHTTENFLWAIDTILLAKEEKMITVADIKDLIKRERFDHFALAAKFKEKPHLFFQEILKKEDLDFDWFRSVFSFMQSHLVKVLSPDDLRKKSKLSQYDQAILEMSEQWSRQNIILYLQFFSECEILAKSSDLQLVNKLRLQIIPQMELQS